MRSSLKVRARIIHISVKGQIQPCNNSNKNVQSFNLKKLSNKAKALGLFKDCRMVTFLQWEKS